MQNLSDCLEKLLRDLNADAAKFLRIAKNNDAYAEAIRALWPDEKAAQLILDHTNAFYIRNDERPRKGPDKDKPYIVCEVCIDDPLVRSEIDTHRELLQLHLRGAGLSFEELRIIPARRGMKKRHPFIKKNED